ncbi:MAG TPA: M48 family metalloprotease [Thermoanaerobaculia bacterium]|nr:M48 family metalloprotease [Thermoanaerobaculia bacterium]
MQTLRALPRWLALTALLAVIACSTNPATGHKQLNFYSQDQEIAMGRQYHEQVVQQIGVYQDRQLQNYVERLGRQLAARSERPDLPWTFTVVDDPAVNAFALPGGFIYVTRGLVDHMGSEAELAGVIGHEIGHVASRHTVNQLSKQQLTQIGLTLGMVLGGQQVQRYGDLVNLAGGLVFLKFSRDDEAQADELGLRYISRSGYPPQAMGNVFTLLSRVSRVEQGGRLPQWLATHPDPETRLKLMQTYYARLPSGLGNEGWKREPLLQVVDGVTYGPDPREGFFRNGVFYHPGLGFAVTSPRGWKGTNQKQAVVWQPREKDAIFALTLANARDARSAAQQFFNQQGVQFAGQLPLQQGGGVEGGQFAANTQQGPVAGAVTFIENGGKVYQLLGFAPQGSFRAYGNEIAEAMRSFQRVSSRELGRVEPWTVSVVKLDAPMTLREFDRRYPSTVPVERVALLNNAELDTRYQAGDELKRVVGGVPGAELE